MGPVRLEIGNAVVYAEPSNVEVATSTDPFGTSDSGISERMVDAYGALKQLLSSIAEDISGSLAPSGPGGPSTLSLELSLSVSAEGNAWVLKAKGEGTVSATLSWDLSTRRA